MRLVWAMLLLGVASCDGGGTHRGDWVITGFRMPGYHAISRSEAQQYVGRRIHLGTPAVSHEERCEMPRFTTRRVLAQPFAAEEYGLDATHFGVSLRDSIDVLEVECDGNRWSALGGRVLFVSADKGYAPWDGVFFTIQPAKDR